LLPTYFVDRQPKEVGALNMEQPGLEALETAIPHGGVNL
jgi:hypothetical protein